MNQKNSIILTIIFSALLIGAFALPVRAKTINAAKMPGFNPANATKALQAALDSGADQVVVPDVGEPWIVTPIQLRSNQTVVFRPGVVILAKKGAFKSRGASLFTASGVKNLTIIGYGATWRMRKSDYDHKPYRHSEWRMGLALRGCTNVTVEGLTIEKTGGDGIYISGGSGQSYSKNITIRNVVLYDNYRQGISVISADQLLIEHTMMRNTGGTLPMAGIDFEPNNPDQQLTNIVMRNCTTWGNKGGGYQFYLVNLNSKSKPVDILVKDCRAVGDDSNALAITTNNNKAKAPRGQIVFEDCIFRGGESGGIKISKPADALKVTFDEGSLIRPAMTQPEVNPVQLTTRSNAVGAIGGVVFDDFKIVDPLGRNPIGYVLQRSVAPLKKVTGNLIVVGPGAVQHIKLTPELLAQWNPTANFQEIPYIKLSDIQLRLSDQTVPQSLIHLDKARLRKQAKYVLYASQGDKVQVKMYYGQMGSYAGRQLKVKVTLLSGKLVSNSTIAFKKTGTVQFTAPESGLYQLSARPGGNYVKVVSSTHPLSIVTPSKGLDMNSSKGTYYFWVPKGTKQFAVRGSGSGSEGFAMTLQRPDGSTVKRLKKITSLVQITVHPKSNQTGKIWKLILDPAPGLFFGDHSVKLLGIPPLLAGAEQAVIRSK